MKKNYLIVRTNPKIRFILLIVFCAFGLSSSGFVDPLTRQRFSEYLEKEALYVAQNALGVTNEQGQFIDPKAIVQRHYRAVFMAGLKMEEAAVIAYSMAIESYDKSKTNGDNLGMRVARERMENLEKALAEAMTQAIKNPFKGSDAVRECATDPNFDVAQMCRVENGDRDSGYFMGARHLYNVYFEIESICHHSSSNKDNCGLEETEFFAETKDIYVGNGKKKPELICEVLMDAELGDDYRIHNINKPDFAMVNTLSDDKVFADQLYSVKANIESYKNYIKANRPKF